MIGKGLGLPLWNPQRPLVLPPEEIVPGDVGTVDTKEGFRKLFNLWEHEHAIRGFLQRPDFKVPFRQLAERDNNRFAEGCALNCGAESSISRIPGGLEFNFETRKSEGACLALTSPTSVDSLTDACCKAVGNFIKNNADSLYAVALLRGLESSWNAPIYFVTSCTKASSCAMASFVDAEPRSLMKLQGRIPPPSPAQPSFIWVRRMGQSVGRSCVSLPGGVPGVQDHALFLSGWKLTISEVYRNGWPDKYNSFTSAAIEAREKELEQKDPLERLVETLKQAIATGGKWLPLFIVLLINAAHSAGRITLLFTMMIGVILSKASAGIVKNGLKALLKALQVQTSNLSEHPYETHKRVVLFKDSWVPSQAAAAERRMKDGNDSPGSPARPLGQPDKDGDTVMRSDAERKRSRNIDSATKSGSATPEAMQVDTDAPQPLYTPKSDATPPGVLPPTAAEARLVNKILEGLGCEKAGVLTAPAVAGRFVSNGLPEGELNTILGLSDPMLSGTLTKVELVMALRMVAWASIGSVSAGATLDDLGPEAMPYIKTSVVPVPTPVPHPTQPQQPQTQPVQQMIQVSLFFPLRSGRPSLSGLD
ncbi:hypothetical protein MD484_g5595, partial [Candolleomyces efflorescens]